MRYLLLFLVLVLAKVGYTQNKNMTLTKIKNEKVKVIEIGNELIIKTIDDLPEVKGKFKGFANGALLVGSDTIALDNILEVIKPFEWRIAGMIVAVPVVLGGLVYAGFSAFILAAGVIYNDNVMVIGGAVDLLIGAGIVYFGLYPYTHRGRKFKIDKKWKLGMSNEIIPVKSSEEEIDYYIPKEDD